MTRDGFYRRAMDKNKFVISEEGRNGTVELGEHGLERIMRKRIGKPERQFIPYKSISFVQHDRKRAGRDTVLLQIGSGTKFEWKVALDAEGFVNEVNRRIVGA